MILAMIISVLGGFVALGCWAYVASQKQQKGESLYLCIEELELMKALLINIQKHRGLTSGCLNGDTSLEGAIQEIRFQTDQLWRKLSPRNEALTQSSLYEGVHTHWHRLKERWREQTVDNVIDQHNRLILNLLYLIENHAEDNADLVKIGREQGIDMIWTDLLETIEAIGQTRAIGTGIVASGRSSAVERIRLKFLIEKVEQHIAKLHQALQKNQLLGHQAQTYTIQALVNAKSLTDFINGHLMTEKNRELSAEHFFGLASASIEPLDKLFSNSTQRLKELSN